MKKILATACALGALIMFSNTASAADPLASIYNWSGFYVGGIAGYGFGDTVHYNGPADTGKLSIDGLTGGIEAGYNFQSDALVLGLESDISISDIHGSHGPALFNTFNCGSGPCKTDVNWLSTTRLRLGYAMDNMLPFVSGGLAIGGVDATIPGDATLTAGKHTQVGWTLGGGLEYGVTPNLSLKTEYLYVDLGKWRYDNNGSDFRADGKFSLVRIGVNYNF